MLLLLFFCFVSILSSRVRNNDKYEEYYVRMKKDHFNFNDDSETYLHRILINEQFYNETHPVVFLYFGNEADITSFYKNTGIMFELGEQFGALILFVEHRYFGKSIPDESLNYFSVEQVLEDFIYSLDYLREYRYLWEPETTPIIGFGGSYGGMLASYSKIKYPQFYTGVLASSAPNLHFPGFVNAGQFAEIVTRSFSVNGCSKTEIQNSLKSLDKMINTPDDYSKLEKYFKPCQTITTKQEASKVYELVFLALQNLAVVNYPTKSEFFQPLPEYPVKIACEKFINFSKIDEIQGLYEILNVYFNSSGSTKCMDLEGWTTYDIYMSYNWRFGRCSQFIMPMEYNGLTDFFYPPRKWDIDQFLQKCTEWYSKKINSVPFWMTKRYHGKEIIGAENIIFSNGDLDPWSSGGVYSENLKKSPGCISIVISGAAHHEDLRASSNNDPVSLKNAREEEKNIISHWIEDKQKMK